MVLLQGDGAFGFSGMEWDTLVRHGVHVVSVVGNNGIWALEKHPMEALYGYSVVAELRRHPLRRVVRALGGHGELVSTPEGCTRAAPERSTAGWQTVVNIGPTRRWPTHGGRIWRDPVRSARDALSPPVPLTRGSEFEGDVRDGFQVQRLGPGRISRGLAVARRQHR